MKEVHIGMMIPLDSQYPVGRNVYIQDLVGLEVPDDSKDNSSSSSSSFFLSDNEVQDVSSDEENKADENKANAEVSMVYVPIYQEDPVVQRTPLIDTVFSMVTKKTTSTPTPPTTQAQVTNVSESNSPIKFEAKILDLEKKVEAMPKRDWMEKDQQWTDEMLKMIDNLLLERRIMSSLEVLGYKVVKTKTELTLEQTQQGVSDEELVSIEGVEE
ncbi:hypothetical protein Tco_1507722 [Tanacetum coccineum]